MNLRIQLNMFMKPRTVILAFRHDPYSVRSGKIVYIRVIQFTILISWTKS